MNFRLRRNTDEWDNYTYSCKDCDQYARTAAEIPHRDDCPVTTPDDVPIPVNDQSEQLIKELIQRAIFEAEDPTQDNIGDIAATFESETAVKWIGQGSTARFVLGIGRTTHKGKFHRADKLPLVIKIDPYIRTNTDYTTVSGNIDELLTWQQAVQTGTTKYFTPIHASAKDGAWLLMEECIPIEYSVEDVKYRGRDYLMDRETIRNFIQELATTNWVSPDYKHGNIALDHNFDPVLIDYGTGPKWNPDANTTN